MTSFKIKLNQMAIVKVGLIQMSCTADVAANKQKAVEKIKEAAKGLSLIHI